jgi:nitrogen fixation-related uncharacterized protein
MQPSSQTYVYVWLVITGLIVLGLIPIIIWAIKTRQFSEQDRARHLPLQSGIPEEKEGKRGTKTRPPESEEKE